MFYDGHGHAGKICDKRTGELFEWQHEAIVPFDLGMKITRPFAPGGICRGWAAGVPSVPWNRPESGFCRADAQMAWQRCPRDCFGDASRAARSNLRRPRSGTADRLLSGLCVSGIPRVDYFRVCRADRRWLRLRLRCRTDASSSHAAPS